MILELSDHSEDCVRDKQGACKTSKRATTICLRLRKKLVPASPPDRSGAIPKRQPLVVGPLRYDITRARMWRRLADLFPIAQNLPRLRIAFPSESPAS